MEKYLQINNRSSNHKTDLKSKIDSRNLKQKILRIETHYCLSSIIKQMETHYDILKKRLVSNPNRDNFYTGTFVIYNMTNSKEFTKEKHTSKLLSGCKSYTTV